MTTRPTHVDSHVGAVFSHKAHFKKYLEVAKALDVAALTFENWAFTTTCMSGLDADDPVVRLARMLTDRLKRKQNSISDWNFPRIDHYCVVPYGPDLDSTRNQLAALIDGLPSGITQVLFHPSDEDLLLRALMPPHVADRRIVIDRHLFDTMNPTDPLDDELTEVKRTNWRKMTARFQAAQNAILCTDPTDGQPWTKPTCCP